MQKKKKNTRRDGRKKYRDKRKILERVSSVLLRSFRESTAKMFDSGGTEVSGTHKEANSYFDSTRRSQGLPHHVKAAIDCCGFIQFQDKVEKNFRFEKVDF